MSASPSLRTCAYALSRSVSLHVRPAARPLHRNLRLARTATPRRTQSRAFHEGREKSVQPAVAPSEPEDLSSNPPLSFPCLDAVESRSASLKRSEQGPEPSYTSGETQNFHSTEPFLLDWGGVLPSFDIAYETWGTLNADKTNAILVHTGLSASSHAASTPANTKKGWWEKFIGPGSPLDTNKYFVICTNVLGGCYGTTGPSSIDPANGQRYATRFPILTMQDMVRAQFRLLDHLDIRKLYASVGSSMGGMQSLAAGVLFPDRVARIVSISGCARSHPYSIALRHVQRQVLMVDPHWARGFYYNDKPGDDKIPPHAGMKLAREIATVTYRSGPEWEQRFGRRRADPSKPPALCPDFLIETYLDHAGEKWCLEYDPNSLLYISKAMDMFDLGKGNMDMLAAKRRENQSSFEERSKGGSGGAPTASQDACTLTLPDQPYQEGGIDSSTSAEQQPESAQPQSASASGPPEDLVAGMQALWDKPALIMGVASDILFPSWQQREIAETLKRVGNRSVTHIELGEDKSLFGHDTFLLDLENIGGALRRFLS